MQPYNYSGDYINFHNSFGCGKSLRWEYEAFSLAVKLNENCGHINVENIIIKIKRDPNKKNPPECKIRCIDCDNRFPQTSAELTKLYIEFYRRNSEK